MGVITWIIIGIIGGWAASALTSLNKRIVIHILVGVFGAVGGGFITNLVIRHPVLEFSWTSLFLSILGATLSLLVVTWMRRED